MRRKQQGNVLFLILMAVALFAMITFVVSQSNRDANTVPRERARIMSSQIITFATQIEQTVMRARTAMRIPEWGLDFSDGNAPSQSESNAYCTTTDCRIFTENGGSIGSVRLDRNFIEDAYRNANPGYGDDETQETYFSIIEITNIGTHQPDVVMRIPGINNTVCEQINMSLWGQDSTVVDEYTGAEVPYSGDMTSIPESTQVLGDENPFWRGKNSGCVRHDNMAGGEFFQVIIAR